jgi:hypothetical protein
MSGNVQEMAGQSASNCTFFGSGQRIFPICGFMATVGGTKLLIFMLFSLCSRRLAKIAVWA